MKDHDKLLTTNEVASLIGVTTKTIVSWRLYQKIGPKFTKVGGVVRYRQSDVKDYLEKCSTDHGE